MPWPRTRNLPRHMLPAAYDLEPTAVLDFGTDVGVGGSDMASLPAQAFGMDERSVPALL